MTVVICRLHNLVLKFAVILTAPDCGDGPGTVCRLRYDAVFAVSAAACMRCDAMRAVKICTKIKILNCILLLNKSIFNLIIALF